MMQLYHATIATPHASPVQSANKVSKHNSNNIAQPQSSKKYQNTTQITSQITNNTTQITHTLNIEKVTLSFSLFFLQKDQYFGCQTGKGEGYTHNLCTSYTHEGYTHNLYHVFLILMRDKLIF